MPLRYFLCPDNQRIEVAECLKEGNCRMSSRCASRSYLRLVSRERIWKGKASTTQLIQGTMCAFLKLTKEYAVSPDDRTFAVTGTKGHAVLESSQDEYSELERRVEREGITGITDNVEAECGVITLIDNKLSGSFKVAKALGFVVTEEETGEVFQRGKKKEQPKMRKILKRDPSKEDRFEWALQENNYRISYEEETGKKIDKLKLQCIVRDGGLWIARSRGVFRKLYYFEIEILTDAYIKDYFRRKKEALFEALKQGYWEEPCNKKENWDGVKCASYCEVAEFCKLGKYLRREKEVEDMSIKGLSEIRRLPRLGKIRLGIKKKKGEVEYPAEIDYFKLAPQTASELENKKYIDIFQQKYGEEAKRIPIMLPIGDIDVVFPQFYKRYGKTTMLQCKGDGVEAVCSQEEFTKDLEVIGKTDLGLSKVKCLGANCPYQKNRQCGRVGTLQILLPELPGSGVWQITTGSYNSIVNVNSCLEYVKAVAGRFHMIPLFLERRLTEIQYTDGQGKPRKGKHHILHINLDLPLAELQRYATIDSQRIMLELPAPEESKEDILFQENVVIDTQATEVKKEQPQDRKLIDESMRRKILALAKAKKWEEKTVEEYIKEAYEVNKIAELDMPQAEQLCQYLKEIPVLGNSKGFDPDKDDFSKQAI